MSQKLPDGHRPGDRITGEGVNISLMARVIRQQMRKVAIDYAIFLRKRNKINGNSIKNVAQRLMASSYHSPRIMELAMYIIATAEEAETIERIKHTAALIDAAYAAFQAATRKETVH